MFFFIHRSWAALLLGALSAKLACGVEVRVLTQVAEIRGLSRDEAARALPVKVRGVVTWQSIVPSGDFVIDDGVQSIYVPFLNGAYARPGVMKTKDLPREMTEPGAVVEVEGVTSPGGYAPVILPASVRRIGSGPLPPARRLSLERLLSGNEDAQRVEVEGVVQAATGPDELGVSTLILMVGGHRCRVRVEQSRGLIPSSLVDARVKVRGFLSPILNIRSEAAGFKVQIMGKGDIEVVVPPPKDPFLAPKIGLDRLLPFSPEREPFHRRVTSGVVSYVRPGKVFFIQEGNTGVRVQSPEFEVHVGERVEVAGFVEMTHTLASISGGIVRSVGQGTAPEALSVTVNQMLGPKSRFRVAEEEREDHYGRLVRVLGRLIKVERDEWNRLSSLLIESDGQIFTALPLSPEPEWLESAVNWVDGAELALTGVCELMFEESAPGQNKIGITGFQLLLRTPEDVQVLSLPSWWTQRRLKLALLWSGVVVGLALIWIILLRWLLRRRTQRLEQVMRSHRDVELEYASAQRERLRLAVDLHDGIKQHLAAASLRVEAAAGHLHSAPDMAATHLETACSTLSRTQTELEECLWGLHAVAEGPPDFVHLLRHVTMSSEHWPKSAVMIESTGTSRHLSRDVAGSLLLLFQEACGNAFRHGKARHVKASVVYEPDALDLRIADDGCGFDPRHVPGPRAGHFGIDGMKKRIHWLRGTLQITQLVEGGTEIHVRLPWSMLSQTDVCGKESEEDSHETR